MVSEPWARTVPAARQAAATRAGKAMACVRSMFLLLLLSWHQKILLCKTILPQYGGAGPDAAFQVRGLRRAVSMLQAPAPAAAKNRKTKHHVTAVSPPLSTGSSALPLGAWLWK